MLRILKNKWFWINLVLGILIIIAFFWGTIKYLDLYTKHGESITVPDIDSMTLTEVEALLRGKNLEYHIMDSVYNPDFRPHEVISQTPPPGSKVKENRKIYVSVRALNPPQLKVPNVEEKSLNSAIRILENNGFKVGRTIYKPYPYANSVIEIQQKGKRLEPGAELPQGAVIDLLVGSGVGDSKVSVPNLAGMTLEEAEFLLTGGYNLNIGFTKYHSEVRTRLDTINSVIYRQIPEPTEEEILRWGEAIDVFLMKRQDYRIQKDTINAENGEFP